MKAFTLVAVVAAFVGCLSAITTQAQPQVTELVPTGSGEQQIHGLLFDPMGADFSPWITHFTREIYRNWIMPQAALIGLRGQVDIEFAVNRDGSLISNRIIRSSGLKYLDRAAKYAIESSHFLSLPDDYRPNRATMRTTFYYNEKPTAEAAPPEKVPQPLAETPSEKAPGQQKSPTHASIASALRNLEGQLRSGQLGVPPGSGEQPIHGLLFDPMGADFSPWITHFTREVYRNWIMPKAAALLGMRGHVELEFRVERDGSLSLCRILTSSTKPDLDKAAKSALESSQFLPLPDDYGPSSVTTRVSFFYNESPHPQD